jgi:predicted XRE-type DNA-binding protein
MNRKLSDKKKCMAYVLNRDPDFRYSQKKIAKMMDVSQSTISNAIDDVLHWMEIRDLTRQLGEARSLLANQGFLPEKPILYLED